MTKSIRSKVESLKCLRSIPSQIYDDVYQIYIDRPVEMELFLLEIDAVYKKYGLTLSISDGNNKALCVQNYYNQNVGMLFEATKDYSEEE